MHRSLGAVALVVAGVAACSSDKTGPVPPPPPPPPASPHFLSFVAQPGTALVDSTIAPAVTVEIQDSIHRRVSSSIAVTIALGTNPGTAMLSGSTTVNAVNGLASFGNVSLDARGRGYTLVATSGTIIGDTSAAFDVVTPLVVDRLAAGSDHVCGVKLGVDTYCWGEGSSGELGDGNAVDQPFPVPVIGGLQFTDLGSGFAATCGLTATHAGYCWGQNLNGKLGDSSFESRSVPTAVIGGKTFVAAPMQGFFHACALGTDSIAYCWGGSNTGQRGDSTNTNAPGPVPVVGGHKFLVLHTVNFHTCGITKDQATYCWGSNTRGQLGDSTNVEKYAPVPVHGGLTFATIGTGGAISCALTMTGDPYCWGGTTPDLWVPKLVPGGLTFTALAVGGVFACGLTADSLAHCWGQIPGGGNPAPRAISQTLRFAAVAAGFNHACGRTVQGHVYCWGTNPRGQLGDGTTASSDVPLRVLY